MHIHNGHVELCSGDSSSDNNARFLSFLAIFGWDGLLWDRQSFVGSVLAFDAHKRGLVSPNKARYERMKRQQKQ